MTEYNSNRDYYKILGVNKNVSLDSIKQARSKLALKYHPDTNRAPDAVHKFRDVQEAYKVLSDINTRQRYDNENNISNRSALKSANWSKGIDSDGGYGSAASVEIFRKRHEARMAEQNNTNIRAQINRRYIKSEYGNQHSPQSKSSATKPIKRVTNQGPKSMAGGIMAGVILIGGVVVLLASKKPVDSLNKNLHEKLGK